MLTKIFNVARFASQFEVPGDLSSPPELNVEDIWILSEFDQCMTSVEIAWKDVDIYTAAQTLKSFGTGIFPVIGSRCQSLGSMRGHLGYMDDTQDSA